MGCWLQGPLRYRKSIYCLLLTVFHFSSVVLMYYYMRIKCTFMFRLFSVYWVCIVSLVVLWVVTAVPFDRVSWPVSCPGMLRVEHNSPVLQYQVLLNWELMYLFIHSMVIGIFSWIWEIIRQEFWIIIINIIYYLTFFSVIIFSCKLCLLNFTWNMLSLFVLIAEVALYDQ